MAIIKVFGFVPDPDQTLRNMEIVPEDCFIWTDIGLRTSDIKNFYKKTASKTVINFYDDPSIIIKEPFDVFYNRFIEVDKDIEEFTEEDQEEE